MVLFAWGAAWLAGQLKKIEIPRDANGAYVIEPQFVQGGTALLLIILGAAVCYWLAYSKPGSSEFLIATEGEMKKVNWSSRKELIGSTWVVVSVAVLLATSLFLVDLGFSKFFQMIQVLNPTN
ncbi:MAG: preprotein translocase subunit SecE [Phycisphaerae bacterium]|nr:preprotein translocase subunit SecE [Phycisphaerae bacterium]